MDLENASDERVRRIVREELNRRDQEKQARCRHAVSATQEGGLLGAGGYLRCDDCGKIMGDEERANRFTGIRSVGGMEKQYVDEHTDV